MTRDELNNWIKEANFVKDIYCADEDDLDIVYAKIFEKDGGLFYIDYFKGEPFSELNDFKPIPVEERTKLVKISDYFIRGNIFLYSSIK